jgi:hypothetical protein
VGDADFSFWIVDEESENGIEEDTRADVMPRLGKPIL